MNNIKRNNRTKKIRKYKGGGFSFKSKSKASTTTSSTPETANKPTMKGRISSMLGFKKKDTNNTDPSGNSLDTPSAAAATAATTSAANTSATTNLDANANTITTQVSPSDAAATGAAVATAAASNVVIEAVKEPLKTGIQEVGQIIPEATEAIGVGLVKAGSNIAGAIPFVGAIMDIGNAANAFTEMIKKLANTGNKLSNTVSDVAEKTKENIESSLPKSGGFQQGGRILKRTNDSIKQFEDPIHTLNYYRHHNIKKNRNITSRYYNNKNITRKRN
jgi:hypothetical protein